MQEPSYRNTPGYLVLTIGLLLSLTSALVPHFDIGYRLMLSVFVAGMLPYLAYGIVVPLMRGPVITMAGLVIVVVHAWLVIQQRFIANADYSDGMIYYVPVMIAVAVTPFVIAAVKKTGKY
jgi:hypothetical protein